MDDLPFLMAVRVQGIAPPDRVALACGASAHDVRAHGEGLVKRGVVQKRTGRVSGYAMTPDGNAVLEEALSEEGLREDEDLAHNYERFLVLNERLLAVASDWQVRRHGSIEAPNDHSDPHYDQSVIDRLCELHDRAAVCLKRMATVTGRYQPYADRLASCIDRLCSGDRSAFTAALAESYHTVWFELHQDLLLTLNLERTA